MHASGSGRVVTRGVIWQAPADTKMPPTTTAIPADAHVVGVGRGGVSLSLPISVRSPTTRAVVAETAPDDEAMSSLM